jgi:TonB family protein
MGYQALLFCPDEKTARTVTHVLNDLDFAVEPCKEPFAAVKRLMAQHFDAVVVDCDNEQNATLLFKSARNSNANQTSLAVAVVEGQAGVAKAFRIGANLVLTKPINVEQAKGTLRVARGLLRKGAEAPKAAPTATASAAPVSPAVPQAARPATPASSRPTTSPIPAAPAFSAPTTKPSIPAPTVQPVVPQAPSRRTAASTFAADARDFDSIFEEDDAEVLEIPSAPAPMLKAEEPAPVASPAAASRNFPWQPAKPMAEPMGSALQRAAEVAGKVEPARPTGAFEALLEEKRPGSIGMHMSRGTAAAPAPAAERIQPMAVAPPVLPAQPPAISPPTFAEPEPPRVVEKQAASHSEPEAVPPTFFPGAYDADEDDGGGKTKAIVIIAAVVLLASSAAYLSWKDTHGKTATAAASGPAATAPAAATPEIAAPVTDATKPQDTAAPTPEVSEIAIGGDSGAATKPAATKPVAKEAAPATDTEAEPEVTQRLIVKKDTRRVTSSPTPDEPVQAPTDVDMGAAPDTKALASISNTPARVPKAVPQVVKVSQGVMEGLVIKRVQPKYPSQAMQLHIQGAVQLEATVSKNGSITNLKVISGDGLLARAAQEAVKQWRYKPYYLNGEPVEIQTQILVNFKLPN